jgi:hypothetical protein
MYVTATRAGNLSGCEPFGAYRGLEDDQVVPDGESGNITRTSPAIHCLDANQTVAVAINNHIPLATAASGTSRLAGTGRPCSARHSLPVSRRTRPLREGQRPTPSPCVTWRASSSPATRGFSPRAEPLGRSLFAPATAVHHRTLGFGLSATAGREGDRSLALQMTSESRHVFAKGRSALTIAGSWAWFGRGCHA